jgi:hypothetical protein
MRLINKNSKRGVINLFAEFILSKFNKKENTIIQVTDCGPFFVINGLTTSELVLDLNKFKDEFTNWFSDLLKDVGIESINLIDLIKYNQEVNPIETGWINVNKSLFTEYPEKISELTVSSEFPYGHSLNCGRLMVYYSHYIMNHCYSKINSNKIDFYFTKDIDENDDFKIEVITTKGKEFDNRLKSMILDVFDFDLISFSSKFEDYELIHDILDPNNNKPYLVQDRLVDTIMF